MRRFPDIVVISWQCDCNQYHSLSIDEVHVVKEVPCKCGQIFFVYLDDLDVDVDIREERHAKNISG